MSRSDRAAPNLRRLDSSDEDRRKEQRVVRLTRIYTRSGDEGTTWSEQ
jgi:hypothetical protein